MSDIPWWLWLIIVAVVVLIIIALVARRKPSVADNTHDPSVSPHIPAGTAEDVSTSQAATTNSAGQAMTSGATAATAAGVTGATSGARRMAEDDATPDAEPDPADPRHLSTPDRAWDDEAAVEPGDDSSPSGDHDDELARAEEALEADQPQRQATDPERVAEEQRGAASDEEAPPVTGEPDYTLGVADSDEGMEQVSTAEVPEQPDDPGLATDRPEATEAPPAALEPDNVDATIAAEDPSHRTPSTHGRDAVESQRRLSEDLGLDPEDDPHAGHSHGGQSQSHRDASTGPGPDHKPYDFPQDTEAGTGVPLAGASEQLQRAEMKERSRDHGYGEIVDSGEKHPELTVDPGSTPPVEEAGPDAREETASVEAGEDYDIPRDEHGRRLDPYGNPVDE